MRSRSHLLTLAMLAAAIGPVEFGGSPAPTPPPPPPNPDLTPRDRLELDLMRAEERLQQARTPRARRKAQRTVDAIRARLGEA